ncbi:MAG: phosphatase PAP2 family protein [Calditrichaeota bacterium]|nr:MAG: phosphatase PAP2 family protein [Calditrichota bacterium]
MIYRKKHPYLYECLICAYCWLMVGFILFFADPIRTYLRELIFYLSISAITLLIVMYIDDSKNRINKFIRYFFPGIMFSFFYTVTGSLMFLIHDSFYDWQLTAFELSLFGVYPTYYIDQHLLNVVLTEIISFCYFSYYFMIPVFMITLFFKKEYKILISSLASICIMFFSSYLLFFLYPIEGPRWHFAGQYTNTIDGPFFRQMVEFVIANGAVRGGCMPSSHFGVALVIWMYCYRYFRKTSWVIMPLVIGLGIGTVWGRFHYVSDVFIGGMIGLIGTLIVWKYEAITEYKTQKLKSVDTTESTT